MLFVVETLWPAQNGQPWPMARSRTCAFHECPAVQRHQHLRVEPATTSAGVSAPFCSASHSATNVGATVASELVTDARCPEQKGHPWARGPTRDFTEHTTRDRVLAGNATTP
jgi:hypothetical protein